MNRILIIRGTGNVGGHVVHQLAATGARFRAMARNPDAASLPPQAEVVRGDLTVPETLDRCLQDIDTVFLVWVPPPAAVAGALSCVGRTSTRVRRRPMSVTWPRSPSALCARRGTPGQRMY